MLKQSLIIVTLIFSFSIYAEPTQNFQGDLNKLLKTFDEDINIAIVISDSAKNKILFAKNKTKNYSPASTLKLFTAYAASYYLGKNYHYRTAIWADGSKLSNNILHDNIYLKFSGDPSLMVSDLDQLLHEINAKGIQEITGNFILDDTSQEQKYWSDGTILEDIKFCFGAGTSAIIINENCINAQAKLSNDKKIEIESDELKFVTVDNKLKYSPLTTEADLEITGDNRYLLTGDLKEDTPLKIAVQNNRLFAKNILTTLLEKNHIKIDNPIVSGATSSNASIIAYHDSPALSLLLTTMLKNSDNIIANTLFKTFAIKNQHNQGSWKGGTAAVQNVLLAKLKIAPNEISIHDGSGESIYDKVQPMHLLKLLNLIYKEDFEAFKSYLPNAGIDGTLKNRMKNPLLKLYAKTGTETGISTLAGFIETKRHHTLSFVIMINDGLLETERYRALEDKICYLIYNHF